MQYVHTLDYYFTLKDELWICSITSMYVLKHANWKESDTKTLLLYSHNRKCPE